MNLLPCPFCGSIPDIYQIGNNAIEIKCICLIKKKQKTLRLSVEWLKEKMITDWNTRIS